MRGELGRTSLAEDWRRKPKRTCQAFKSLISVVSQLILKCQDQHVWMQSCSVPGVVTQGWGALLWQCDPCCSSGGDAGAGSSPAAPQGDAEHPLAQFQVLAPKNKVSGAFQSKHIQISLHGSDFFTRITPGLMLITFNNGLQCQPCPWCQPLNPQAELHSWKQICSFHLHLCLPHLCIYRLFSLSNFSLLSLNFVIWLQLPQMIFAPFLRGLISSWQLWQRKSLPFEVSILSAVLIFHWQ